jgi:hypothetical protein
MKFAMPTRLLISGLVLATFGLTALAKLASDDIATHSCASDNSRTLVLEDAAGNVRRLVHSRDQGWRFVSDAQPEDSSSALQRVNLSLLPSAHARDSAPTSGNSADGQPMAVFIDGPTGYTFAWTGDSGWKFVGQISDDQS